MQFADVLISPVYHVDELVHMYRYMLYVYMLIFYVI